MLRSFDGLALRQLRTPPPARAADRFGIVLGVGMVFGVLLLVGTIRHTFDDLIDSAWGKTDLVVDRHGAGCCPQRTLDRVRVDPGVRDAGAMVGGVFTRLDRRRRARSRATPGRCWSPATSRAARRRTTSASSRAARRAPARGRASSTTGRATAASTLGDDDRASRRRPGARGCTSWASSGSRAALSFGGQGLAAHAAGRGAHADGHPDGYIQISVVADDRGQGRRRCRRGCSGGSARRSR